jgi:hypothetical protein
MKTLTKISTVAVLVIAAASPALAKHKKPVHHTGAMTQFQQDQAYRARAYAPPAQWESNWKCCSPADY